MPVVCVRGEIRVCVATFVMDDLLISFGVAAGAGGVGGTAYIGGGFGENEGGPRPIRYYMNTPRVRTCLWFASNRYRLSETCKRSFVSPLDAPARSAYSVART